MGRILATLWKPCLVGMLWLWSVECLWAPSYEPGAKLRRGFVAELAAVGLEQPAVEIVGLCSMEVAELLGGR